MNRRDNDVRILQWCMDGCSKCLEYRPARPFFIFLVESKSSIRAHYRCDNCEHEWFTSWDYNFAIEHGLDHMFEAGIPVES